MSGRTASLVKELAQLFVRYRLTDWAPIVKELEAAGRGTLAQEVARLATAAPPKAARKAGGSRRARKPAPKPAAPLALRPERSQALTRLHDDLSAKTLLPSIGDLRSAFVALGIKDAPGARRSDSIRTIVEHLNAVDDQRFEGAVTSVLHGARRSGGGMDYQRWFELIGSEKQPGAT